LVLEREAVRRWWKQQRQAACAGEPAGRCLVTGELAPLADRHTILKQVPGAVSSGVPLVSFNAPAFESYGLSGNENAPISREAAESYAAALQRLLHAAPPDPLEPRRTLPRRNLRLSDDTAVCYWPAEPSGEGFASALGPLLEGNEETVGELYRSVWFGRAPRIADPSAFYALTISGAQGRAIVRGWLESTVAEVAGHVARHFADLEMVRNLPPPKEGRRPPRPPLRALLASLAVQGKSDLIPAPLAARLVVAALSGAPYPLALLQRAILRARAESGDRGWAAADRRDARAALLKAVLERRRRLYEASTPYPEIRPDMDPNNTNPGYLLGRLMAVIERLQQTALGDVNATVVDRYFGAASAAPRSVFIRLLKNARHHARKAKEDPAKQGMGHWLDRQLDELCKGFDPEHNGFPAHLSLEEQGLFILGYHQQRHWLWLSKDARAALAVGQEEAGEETDAG
jgi:CRISPR-associated protein Csd1